MPVHVRFGFTKMKRFIRVYGSGSGSVRHPGIYITKICNYDCSFSKIIKLRITRRTKGAKEGILSRLVTNFDKQR